MTNYVLVLLVIFAIITVFKTAIVVPQQNAFVVEFLGRYQKTLEAGFSLVWPFLQQIRAKHTLKEQPLEIPEQICITRDNVQVAIDGVIYIKVLDPKRATYEVEDYNYAISQLAQTTLRSEIGKIELDRTFEERTSVNTAIVAELDKATEAWGVKVLRYEIKSITPPHDVLAAMEKQMRAEREKRATVLTSEGQRDAMINEAEGAKQKVIKQSEAIRESQLNEALGEAAAINAIAQATADGIRKVAEVIISPGGMEATRMRLSEQYIEQFGKLAKSTTTVVLPSNLADVGSMIATVATVLDKRPR